MKVRKALALILAAQMLLGGLAACSKPSPGGTETGGGQPNPSGGENTPAVTETKAPEANVSETDAPETDAPETEFDRNSVSDDLPDIKFDGKEFRVLSTAGYDAVNGYLAEDYNGEAKNDAQYERNQTVQDRFDVKLSIINGPGETHNDLLMYVQSDEDIAEVADLIQFHAGKPMGWGILSDWMQVPHINLEKPWWHQHTNNDLIINNKAYIITGDYAISTLQWMWVMNFNYNLMEEFGYTPDEIYQLIFDGEWTIDKMFEIASTIYRDENGDGQANMGDIFGYGTPTFNGTDGWITAIDARILSKDSDGNLAVTLGEEKVFNTLEKLVKHFYSTPGVYGYALEDQGNQTTHWTSGLLAIRPTMFQDSFGVNTNLNFDYGIIPYPKYDTAQAGYYNGGMDQVAVYGLPITVPTDRYEFVGTVLEALMAESYKQVYPVYYEQALLGRAAADANAYRCIEIIMEGRTYDMAFPVSHLFEGLPYQFRWCIADHSTDLASALAEQKPMFDDSIAKLNQFFIDGKAFMDRPEAE